MADAKKVEERKKQLLKHYTDLLLTRWYEDDPNRPPDKTFLTISGETIGTAGNFVVFTGLPKVGKSTVISAMVASGFTKDPVLGLKIDLTGIKNKIGYFDTEQSPFDFKRQLERVKRFSHKGTFKNLDCFLLREDTTQDIINIIHAYLKTESKCGILIIDGLLDLINNMNDEGESKRLIRILKKWGKMYGVLIVSVLHVGKKDFTSIGHIGSSVDRYAQSVLLIEKEKDGSFTIKPKYLRSAAGFKPLNVVYDHAINSFVLNDFL